MRLLRHAGALFSAVPQGKVPLFCGMEPECVEGLVVVGVACDDEWHPSFSQRAYPQLDVGRVHVPILFLRQQPIFGQAPNLVDLDAALQRFIGGPELDVVGSDGVRSHSCVEKEVHLDLSQVGADGRGGGGQWRHSIAVVPFVVSPHFPLDVRGDPVWLPLLRLLGSSLLGGRSRSRCHLVLSFLRDWFGWCCRRDCLVWCCRRCLLPCVVVGLGCGFLLSFVA